MKLMQIEHINTGYGKKQVLFDVSLDIEQGNTLLIVGANGSGKSTLFKSIYGILPLWNGKITYKNEVLHETTPNLKFTTHNSKLLPKGIMYIPQKNELFDDLSVYENLELSLLHKKDKQNTRQKIDEVLEKLPVLRDKLKKNINTLSGGEKKFVSLGMVLLNKPDLLLYDEPLAGLANENIDTVVDTLQQIKQNGTTLVIIEHRVKEVFPIADKIIGFKLGKVYMENLNILNNIKRFMI